MSKRKNLIKQKIKEERQMISLKKHCSPVVFLEKSLAEMKLIRKNKLTKTTWKQLKDELKNDNQED